MDILFITAFLTFGVACYLLGLVTQSFRMRDWSPPQKRDRNGKFVRG